MTERGRGLDPPAPGSLRVAPGVRIPLGRTDLAVFGLGRPWRSARQHVEHAGRGPLRRRRVAEPAGVGPGADPGARWGPVVTVAASDERSQARNRALALDRLADPVGPGAGGSPAPKANPSHHGFAAAAGGGQAPAGSGEAAAGFPA